MIAKTPLEALKQVHFLAATISIQTPCIGSDLCHVDGNCIRCVADSIQRVADRFTNTKVFKVSDIEWYLGQDADEAVRKYSEDCGVSIEEIKGNHTPLEVTEAALDKLIFTDDNGKPRTFRAELSRRVTEGDMTGLFATTEW